MSMAEMLNLMRREAIRTANLRADLRVGIVDTFRADKYAAKVQLMPQGDLTGFLPILTMWMGNGWGMVSPLSAGDQVVVGFQQSGKNTGIILGRLYDFAHTPPKAQPGEFWLVHQSGSFLKITNDQKVSLNGQVEADLSAPTVNLTATMAVNVTAPAISIGSSEEALQALLTAAAAAVYNGHTHPSLGAPPTQKIVAADMTTALQAG